MSEFPRIVRFLGTDDAPDSSCPHCGCTGRYIHRFVVEDGRTLAAMSGCVKLFPCSLVAIEEQRLRKKVDERAQRGWKLSRADMSALAAIEDFYAGRLDAGQARSGRSTTRLHEPGGLRMAAVMGDNRAHFAR